VKNICGGSVIEKAFKTENFLASSQRDDTMLELRRNILKRCTSNFGFVLLRGFPLANSDLNTTKRRFSLFGQSLGTTLPQDSLGQHLGELSAQTRGEDWHNALPFHTDGADLLLLLGVQPALSGGLTKLACAAAVLETMQIEYPDKWPLLFEPWAFHRANRPGRAYFERPIFKRRSNSTPDCFFLPGTIRKTPSITGMPLRPEQLQALELFEEIAERPDHHLRLTLSAGDVLIVNNHKVLHGRTQYADNTIATPRVLLRMWVNVLETELV
jgi:alpha-ketoglutarate-dependent taurine dioxygenase